MKRSLPNQANVSGTMYKKNPRAAKSKTKREVKRFIHPTANIREARGRAPVARLFISPAYPLLFLFYPPLCGEATTPIIITFLLLLISAALYESLRRGIVLYFQN